MAGHVVTALRDAGARALAIGIALTATSACGSFNPVPARRYVLLNGDTETYLDLGISGAHWVAYDDQHSRTAACTNGAAGNHAPRECSHLDSPYFGWEGGKCPPTPEQLKKVNDTLANVTDRICIQGELSPFVPCNNPSAQCLDAQWAGKHQDVSNMWGAGMGLSFSDTGKQAWNPKDHGVTGVAFDIVLFPDDTKLGDNNLNLRVQIPSILKDWDTQATYAQPFLTDEGSVVDKDGNVYKCNGMTGEPITFPTLENVISDRPITSEQHPYGSSFWQPEKAVNSKTWGPSPLEPGHNEFPWTEVAPPPGDVPFVFDDTRILGIHFQVAHPQNDARTTGTAFGFCIEHLALLME